jgi:hypothetical protein
LSLSECSPAEAVVGVEVDDAGVDAGVDVEVGAGRPVSSTARSSCSPRSSAVAEAAACGPSGAHGSAKISTLPRAATAS